MARAKHVGQEQVEVPSTSLSKAQAVLLGSREWDAKGDLEGRTSGLMGLMQCEALVSVVAIAAIWQTQYPRIQQCAVLCRRLLAGGLSYIDLEALLMTAVARAELELVEDPVVEPDEADVVAFDGVLVEDAHGVVHLRLINGLDQIALYTMG